MAQYTFDLPDRIVNACAVMGGWTATIEDENGDPIANPVTQLDAGVASIIKFLNKKVDNYYVDGDAETERDTSRSAQEASVDRATEV